MHTIIFYILGHLYFEDFHSDGALNILRAALDCIGGFLLTEKDLKKLNRYQLLELLIEQTERVDKLQNKLDAAEKYIANHELQISSLGSIAEASLQVKGVFQAAQDAADMYIGAAKKRAEEIEDAAHKKAAVILSQAQEQARRIKGD